MGSACWKKLGIRYVESIIRNILYNDQQKSSYIVLSGDVEKVESSTMTKNYETFRQKN